MAYGSMRGGIRCRRRAFTTRAQRENSAVAANELVLFAAACCLLARRQEPVPLLTNQNKPTAEDNTNRQRHEK